MSSWRNGGSVGTPNATQGTGSAQPTYRASTAAFGNKPTVQFATDDWLVANPTDISQPFYVVAVANQSTAGTERIFGTGAGSNLLGYGGNATVWQLNNGSALTGGTSDANPHLWRGVFNGASSVLDLDEGADEITGNAGAGTLQILSLGAGNNGAGVGGNFLNGHIAYLGVFSSDPTADAGWGRFKAWVTSFYGITVA